MKFLDEAKDLREGAATAAPAACQLSGARSIIEFGGPNGGDGGRGGDVVVECRRGPI